MSNDKPEVNTQVPQDITYEDFKIYADANPGSDNSDFYKEFPSKPTSTIRRWKMKYKESERDPDDVPGVPEQEGSVNKTLNANNKTLMRGTLFTEKTFQGMRPEQINRFLLNYHNQKKKDIPDEGDSNSPIVGTPVGSGRPKMFIDQFLTMDAKNKKIEFEAPGSIVFGQVKNKKEAENKWVQP